MFGLNINKSLLSFNTNIMYMESIPAMSDVEEYWMDGI